MKHLINYKGKINTLLTTKSPIDSWNISSKEKKGTKRRNSFPQ